MFSRCFPPERVRPLLTMATSSSSSSSSTSASSDVSAQLIKQAKKALRREIGAKLTQLGVDECGRQSSLVHQRLFALPEFQQAKRVGLYLSLPGIEVDTVPILEHCFTSGKRCFVPKYRPKTRQMDFVELYSLQDYEDLPVEPKWQIKQPDPADTSRAEALTTGGLDVLLMPGVAFTRAGHRLGHGAGYFDTWLARCAQTADIVQPVKIALALTPQLIQQLPVTDWDVPVDVIVLPDESIKRNN